MSCGQAHSSAREIVEPIQHQVPTSRAIEQGIGNQSDRFHRGVQSQEIAFITLFGEGIYAWIFPDVGAIATESTKLDVISVLSLAISENENKLVA